MTLTWGVQAEHLFTPKEYETTLLFVLDHCAVDTATLDQINTLSQASLEDRRLNLKMSRMTVIQGRPRLRDRVTSELKTEERRAQVWHPVLANLVWDRVDLLHTRDTGGHAIGHMGFVHWLLLQASVPPDAERAGQEQAVLPGKPDTVGLAAIH